MTVSGDVLPGLDVGGQDLVADLQLADRDGRAGGEQHLGAGGKRLAAALLGRFLALSRLRGCGGCVVFCG